MEWWQLPFFLIGAFASAVFLFFFFRRVVSAARRSIKICYIYNRIRGKRGADFGLFNSIFIHEMFGYYDSLVIGPYKIDRNPNKKITKAY